MCISAPSACGRSVDHRVYKGEEKVCLKKVWRLQEKTLANKFSQMLSTSHGKVMKTTGVNEKGGSHEECPDDSLRGNLWKD